MSHLLNLFRGGLDYLIDELCSRGLHPSVIEKELMRDVAWCREVCAVADKQKETP